MKTKLLIIFALLCGACFGQNTLAGKLTVQQTVQLTGDITPTAISANQNDYAPTGYATASIMYLSSDAPRTITGLAGGLEGRQLQLFYSGTGGLTLANESASSTAVNRFAIGSDCTVPAGGSVSLIYDVTASRWKILGRISYSKSDVGLGNVDNTSDVNKPVSTAQATADALNLKIASNFSDINDARLGLQNLAGVRTVATIAALKALSVTSLTTGFSANVSGYYVSGDGGGGQFVYDSSSSVTADDGMVVQPTSGSGRWLRQAKGDISMSWFGTKGDATLSAGAISTGTDDTAAMQAWATYITAHHVRGVIDASKVYRLTGTVTFTGAADVAVNYNSSGNVTAFSPFIFYHDPASANTDCFIFQQAPATSGYVFVSLDGITMRGTTNSRYGFKFISDTQLTQKNCNASYFDYGVLWETLIRSSITNCSFNRNRVYGGKHTSTSSTGTTTMMSNCGFSGNEQYGLYIEKCLDWTLAGSNYFESTNLSQGNSPANCAALLVDNGTSLIAQHVYLEGNAAAIGISVGPTSSTTCSAYIGTLTLVGGGTSALARPDVIRSNYCSYLYVGRSNNPGGSYYRSAFIRLLDNTANAVYAGTNNDVPGIGGSARVNSTAYALGDRIAVGNYVWACKTAGTSAGSAPAALSDRSFSGSTHLVTDGTVSWELANNFSYKTVPFMAWAAPSSLNFTPYVRQVLLGRADDTDPYTYVLENDASNVLNCKVSGTVIWSYDPVAGTFSFNKDISNNQAFKGNRFSMGSLTSPSAGQLLNLNGDPGTFTFSAANAWIGIRSAPQRAGTTGNAFGFNSQIRLDSGTQTYGIGYGSDDPQGTVTNMTHFLAGTRQAPTGNFVLWGDSGAGSAYNTDGFSSGGDYSTDTIGKTYKVKSGSNALAGTVTLTAGAGTISSTAIDANTVIVLTLKTVGGTVGGQPYVDTITPATGCTVTGGGGSNTSTYNWVALKVN